MNDEYTHSSPPSLSLSLSLHSASIESATRIVRPKPNDRAVDFGWVDKPALTLIYTLPNIGRDAPPARGCPRQRCRPKATGGKAQEAHGKRLAPKQKPFRYRHLVRPIALYIFHAFDGAWLRKRANADRYVDALTLCFYRATH